ncbi:MAG: hypothetical protein IPK55_10825 [Streptococcus sp.]|nr:hypothetical protein [Streptococcus sp.]
MYHKEQLEVSKEKSEPLQKEQKEQKKQTTKANLFFQAFDVISGKMVNKPLAMARRKMIELIGENPSEYQVRLVQGSTEQVTQSADDGIYPTVAQIEQGVVGQIIKNGQIVYLGKDGLTTNPEEATMIDYEVDGEKRKAT